MFYVYLGVFGCFVGILACCGVFLMCFGCLKCVLRAFRSGVGVLRV